MLLCFNDAETFCNTLHIAKYYSLLYVVLIPFSFVYIFIIVVVISSSNRKSIEKTSKKYY